MQQDMLLSFSTLKTFSQSKALVLSREPKSVILCESVKQTYKIFDFDMAAYSESTPQT
jgi:hypothetical protein